MISVKGIKKNLTAIRGKKRILGLALGSGGARGFAHVGALKAFEEAGLRFDCVAGTSIGSVVGGMYCAGFSAEAMTEYLSQLNVSLKTLIGYKLKGITAYQILDRIMGGAHFDELSLPFVAVAVELYSGKEVRLTSGSVARAMSASSAVPPVFKAVSVNGKMLVDGAFANAIPADAVSDMGADFIIGVNLSAGGGSNARMKRSLDEMYPQNGVSLCDRDAIGYRFCSFMVEPDLKKYSAASLFKFNEMYEIGYERARADLPRIMHALKNAEASKGKVLKKE